MEGFLKGHLPSGFKSDEWGNYFVVIGENPTTMFACHLDTCSDKQEKVIHVQDSQYIRTNGKTILGADDKAGAVVLMYMIENKVPGLYYFFAGEEVGCIGSTKVAENWEENQYYNSIKKVISFDRRGVTSIITHQILTRCCSDEFAKELSVRLNKTHKRFRFASDNTGMITDSACFMELIPECTNISVGFGKEHTNQEFQDILFLENLCHAVVQIDWETLPVKRDHTVEEEIKINYNHNLKWTDEYFSYFIIGNEVKKMYISKTQIEKERTTILSWIREHGINSLVNRKLGYNNNSSIYWNGNELFIENESTRWELISKRIDLMKIIPDIGGVSMKHLRFDLNQEMVY
jgi:hypothetical protein